MKKKFRDPVVTLNGNFSGCMPIQPNEIYSSTAQNRPSNQVFSQIESEIKRLSLLLANKVGQQRIYGKTPVEGVHSSTLRDTYLKFTDDSGNGRITVEMTDIDGITSNDGLLIANGEGDLLTGKYYLIASTAADLTSYLSVVAKGEINPAVPEGSANIYRDMVIIFQYIADGAYDDVLEIYPEESVNTPHPVTSVMTDFYTKFRVKYGTNITVSQLVTALNLVDLGNGTGVMAFSAQHIVAAPVNPLLTTVFGSEETIPKIYSFIPFPSQVEIPTVNTVLFDPIFNSADVAKIPFSPLSYDNDGGDHYFKYPGVYGFMLTHDTDDNTDYNEVFGVKKLTYDINSTNFICIPANKDSLPYPAGITTPPAWYSNNNPVFFEGNFSSKVLEPGMEFIPFMEVTDATIRIGDLTVSLEYIIKYGFSTKSVIDTGIGDELPESHVLFDHGNITAALRAAPLYLEEQALNLLRQITPKDPSYADFYANTVPENLSMLDVNMTFFVNLAKRLQNYVIIDSAVTEGVGPTTAYPELGVYISLSEAYDNGALLPGKTVIFLQSDYRFLAADAVSVLRRAPYVLPAKDGKLLDMSGIEFVAMEYSGGGTPCSAAHKNFTINDYSLAGNSARFFITQATVVTSGLDNILSIPKNMTIKNSKVLFFFEKGITYDDPRLNSDPKDTNAGFKGLRTEQVVLLGDPSINTTPTDATLLDIIGFDNDCTIGDIQLKGSADTFEYNTWSYLRVNLLLLGNDPDVNMPGGINNVYIEAIKSELHNTVANTVHIHPDLVRNIKASCSVIKILPNRNTGTDYRNGGAEVCNISYSQKNFNPQFTPVADDNYFIVFGNLTNNKIANKRIAINISFKDVSGAIIYDGRTISSIKELIFVQGSIIDCNISIDINGSDNFIHGKLLKTAGAPINQNFMVFNCGMDFTPGSTRVGGSLQNTKLSFNFNDFTESAGTLFSKIKFFESDLLNKTQCLFYFWNKNCAARDAIQSYNVDFSITGKQTTANDLPVYLTKSHQPCISIAPDFTATRVPANAIWPATPAPSVYYVNLPLLAQTYLFICGVNGGSVSLPSINLQMFAGVDPITDLSNVVLFADIPNVKVVMGELFTTVNPALYDKDSCATLSLIASRDEFNTEANSNTEIAIKRWTTAISNSYVAGLKQGKINIPYEIAWEYGTDVDIMYYRMGFTSDTQPKLKVVNCSGSDIRIYATSPRQGMLGRTIKGDWVTGDTYDFGDVLNYSGVFYISRQNANTGNDPATSPEWWSPINIFPPTIEPNGQFAEVAENLINVRYNHGMQMQGMTYSSGYFTNLISLHIGEVYSSFLLNGAALPAHGSYSGFTQWNIGTTYNQYECVWHVGTSKVWYCNAATTVGTTPGVSPDWVEVEAAGGLGAGVLNDIEDFNARLCDSNEPRYKIGDYVFSNTILFIKLTDDYTPSPGTNARPEDDAVNWGIAPGVVSVYRPASFNTFNGFVVKDITINNGMFNTGIGFVGDDGDGVTPNIAVNYALFKPVLPLFAANCIPAHSNNFEAKVLKVLPYDVTNGYLRLGFN